MENGVVSPKRTYSRKSKVSDLKFNWRIKKIFRIVRELNKIYSQRNMGGGNYWRYGCCCCDSEFIKRFWNFIVFAIFSFFSPKFRKPRPPESLRAKHRKKHPFLFQKEFSARKIRKVRSVLFRCPPSPRGGGGACDIICFENRCELGTIKTPEWNLAVENQPWIFS